MYMHLSYRFREFADSIKAFLNPRQKWLTKKIPNTWCDKVELIPLCLFEMIKHFVEDEIDSVPWSLDEDVEKGYCTREYSDKMVAAENKIREIYNYYTVVRPDLYKQLDGSFPDLGANFMDSWNSINIDLYKTMYSELNRLEELIEKKDTEYLLDIIKLRGYLWT